MATGYSKWRLDGGDVRQTASKLSGAGVQRLLAVADVLDGEDPAFAGLDHGVPGKTIARWCDILNREGIEALVDMDEQAPGLSDIDPEIPAWAVFNSFAGLERTALRGVAAACRGARFAEIADYHHASEAEVKEWIAVFQTGGVAAIVAWFRRRENWRSEPDQAFVGRRKLPFGYSDRFLRSLQLRAKGDFADRLLALALAYEGRTIAQIAESMRFTTTTIGSWIKNFIRSGMPGIAARGMQISWVPNRRDFSASSVEALASDARNIEYKRRLLVVADAYRGLMSAEIADRRGVNQATIGLIVRAFEADGPAGLAVGRAMETPELRSDYSSERLRVIAKDIVDDDLCVRKLETLARIYDGANIHEAGKGFFSFSGVTMLVDRFQRFGHEITHSFKPHLMAPKAPTPKKVPTCPVVATVAMRGDLNAMRMERLWQAYTPAAADRIAMVIDAYNGLSLAEIASRRNRTASSVSRWLNDFNRHGLEALEPFRKKKSKLPRRKPVTPTASTVRRLELSGEWDTPRVRGFIWRCVDESHRRDLEVIARLYEAHGDVRRASKLAEVDRAEVERLAAAFDLYGEKFGRNHLVLRELQTTVEIEELRLACSAPLPLGTYAQVVNALYCGKRLGNIRMTFSLEPGELERIVEAYNLGQIQGLADDPLGIGKKTIWHRPEIRPAKPAPVKPIAPPTTTIRHESVPSPARPTPNVPTREYTGPVPTASQKIQLKSEASAAAFAMFEGRNAHRLDAVREFHRNRNIHEVARQFKVSAGTLEKWLVAYVTTGMAARDREASN